MNDRESPSNSSNTGLVILVAVLLLGVPCVGFLALAGVGLFVFRSSHQPAPPQPPVMMRDDPASPEVAPPVTVPDEASVAPSY